MPGIPLQPTQALQAPKQLGEDGVACNEASLHFECLQGTQVPNVPHVRHCQLNMIAQVQPLQRAHQSSMLAEADADRR